MTEFEVEKVREQIKDTPPEAPDPKDYSTNPRFAVMESLLYFQVADPKKRCWDLFSRRLNELNQNILVFEDAFLTKEEAIAEAKRRG